MSWAAVASLVRASAQSSSRRRTERPAYPSPSSSKARVRLAMIVASRSPVDAAAARAWIPARRPCGARLLARRAPLPTLVVQRQVVGQPPQMPCPGDLADVAQLQRATILLHAPLSTVLVERGQAQTNPGLLFGRRHLRERRNSQLFGLLIAAGAVEQHHRLGDQESAFSVVGAPP